MQSHTLSLFGVNFNFNRDNIFLSQNNNIVVAPPPEEEKLIPKENIDNVNNK